MCSRYHDLTNYQYHITLHSMIHRNMTNHRFWSIRFTLICIIYGWCRMIIDQLQKFMFNKSIIQSVWSDWYLVRSVFRSPPHIMLSTLTLFSSFNSEMYISIIGWIQNKCEFADNNLYSTQSIWSTFYWRNITHEGIFPENSTTTIESAV